MTDETKTAPRVVGAEAAGNDETEQIHSITRDEVAQLLSPEHLSMLRDESGISDEVIAARGYRTITDRDDLAELGFASNQRRIPGLLLPLHSTDADNALNIYRPDNPRIVENRRKKLADGTHSNRVIKYEVPRDAGTRVDCPPMCQPKMADPSIELWITEGQKKADALVSRGLCVIALLGVWNWKGRNSFGGTTLLADFDYIAWKERNVRLVFDSDVTTKKGVRQALERLTEHLQRKGAHVTTVYLPHSGNGKTGVDDWLAEGHTIEELKALVEAPRPEPQPAAAKVELLDEPAPAMRRPLALVDEQAYAATWLPIRVTLTEGLDKKGNIIKFSPPKVENRTQMFVVRDDGMIFGALGADETLAELGLEVKLPETPRPRQTWSTAGVKSYRAGDRPDAGDVFSRVADVVDRFLDFNKSLADQRTMSEAVACYVLSTWFLPAFNVVGYLWPNGDRGSGKTILLHTVAEMAYLGAVILAGGSYASLRDLADYGATLAFDDAENLSDPRKSDPDKRTLLLAGNRRGSTVTVKEPGPDRTWVTRHVDAFCPRLFSAIRLPDNVLASRSIVIPLIRTPDRYRANADPLDYDAWPHDRRGIVDNLWALALAHLPELAQHDKTVSDKASLTGRNLEPWKAILAVANWLTEQGVEGLWERMDKLSVSYQTERPDLEISDLTALLIRTLCKLAHDKIDPALDVSDVNDISDINIESKDWCFLTSSITTNAVQIVEDAELDINTDHVTSRRIGRALGKMRLQRDRQKGTGRRMWHVSWDELRQWTTTYAISIAEATSLRDFGFNPKNDVTLSCNVTNVSNVTNVKTDNDDLREVVI